MSLDTLLALLASIPPDSRQPLLLAGAGLLLLAFLAQSQPLTPLAKSAQASSGQRPAGSRVAAHLK